jgi:hypothetical protein
MLTTPKDIKWKQKSLKGMEYLGIKYSRGNGDKPAVLHCLAQEFAGTPCVANEPGNVGRAIAEDDQQVDHSQMQFEPEEIGPSDFLLKRGNYAYCCWSVAIILIVFVTDSGYPGPFPWVQQ